MDNSNLKQKTNFLTFAKSENNDRFFGQSKDSGETTVNQMEMSGTETHAVADFHNEVPTELISILPKQIDATYASNDFVMSSLSTWLERPRVIITRTWAVDATGFAPITFFPYFEFLRGATAAPLINKLNNHFLLRGTLHLKFLVNGSPFHYGRARAVYRPGQFDNSYPPNLNPRQALGTSNYVGFSAFPPLLTTYSQRQGVMIDPGTNQPVEMDIPFFCVKNYIDLRSQNADLEQLGAVTLYPQNLLRHANNAIDPVTITVYAHMVNPMLCTASSQNAFQGESKDEYGKGVISKPASAVARFAGRLANAPIIGKYAMATEIGASAVSSISSLWGYSRPVNLQPSSYMRPRLFGSFANTAGEESIAKLSLDPKQETSIDPATVGIDSVDQMSLAYVLQRESLLHTFTWSTLNSQGSLLCGIKVHPNVYPISLSSAPALRVHYQTALAFACAPFSAWRGSLHYRIQIVASPNHRGRILVQYDPNHIGAATPPNLQTRFSQILDLTEARDMTFCVNYNRSELYLPTDWEYSDTAMISNVLTAGFVTANKLTSNGVLVFSVLNELAAPIATSVVDINVYVKAGDDFELHNPTPLKLDTLSYSEPTTFAGSVINLNGGEAVEEQLSFQAESKFNPTADCENAVEQCKYFVINGTAESSVANDLKKIAFGEQIVSIRSLLKRYNLVDICKSNNAVVGIGRVITYFRPNIPAGPGLPYGNSTPTTGGYNFCKMNTLRYFMGGFAGYRGGMRYKYLTVGAANPVYVTANRDVEFLNLSGRAVATAITVHSGVAQTPANLAFTFAGLLGDLGSKAGLDITYFDDNAGIEFELPWQSLQRFQYCHNPVYLNDLPVNLAYNDFQRQGHQVNFLYTSGNTQDPYVLTFAATAEDFSFFHFINAPIMFERNIVAPA